MMTLKPNVESLFARAEQAVEQRHADDIAAGDLASYLVLDVREDAEYQTNRLAGAISLPRSRLHAIHPSLFFGINFQDLAIWGTPDSAPRPTRPHSEPAGQEQKIGASEVN